MMEAIHTDQYCGSVSEWCFIDSLDTPVDLWDYSAATPPPTTPPWTPPWEEEEKLFGPAIAPPADADRSVDSSFDSMATVWANSMSTSEDSVTTSSGIQTMTLSYVEDCADSDQITLWYSAEEEEAFFMDSLGLGEEPTDCVTTKAPEEISNSLQAPTVSLGTQSHEEDSSVTASSGLQTTIDLSYVEDCADSNHITLWSSAEEEAIFMASVGLGEEPTICVITTAPAEISNSLQATDDSVGTQSQQVVETVEEVESTIKNQTAATTETETLHPWSEEEDQILRAAMADDMSSMQQQPIIPWQRIAQALPFKQPLEVLNRTNHWLQWFQRDISSLIISSEQQQVDLAATSDPPILPKGKKRKMRTKWTDEEHKSFLSGIEMFGWGKWKEMAAANLIPTRTVSQITSHAQIYQKHTNVPIIPNPNKMRRRT